MIFPERMGGTVGEPSAERLSVFGLWFLMCGGSFFVPSVLAWWTAGSFFFRGANENNASPSLESSIDFGRQFGFRWHLPLKFPRSHSFRYTLARFAIKDLSPCDPLSLTLLPQLALLEPVRNAAAILNDSKKPGKESTPR